MRTLLADRDRRNSSGIGGTPTRMGYTEVLYVTELAGLLLTWMGYQMSVRPVSVPVAA